jgi:hypothetical protein
MKTNPWPCQDAPINRKIRRLALVSTVPGPEFAYSGAFGGLGDDYSKKLSKLFNNKS